MDQRKDTPVMAKSTDTSGGTRTETVLVTPELAASWLDQNSRNRSLSVPRVNVYALDMRKGTWAYNPQPIILTAEGQLLDGQHRLHAVIKSGVPTNFEVVFGAPRETQDVIDRGRTRSVKDTLAFSGVTNANVVAAAARQILRYDGYPGVVWSGGSAPTPDSEVIALVGEFQDQIQSAAYTARLLSRVTPLTVSSWTAALFLIHRDTRSPERVDSFVTELIDGTGPYGSATMTLRKQVNVSLWGMGQAALLIALKAWANYVEGRPLRLVRAKRDELPMRKVV
jgi:hypothetical protein